jgi:cysteine-rich repeat protein
VVLKIPSAGRLAWLEVIRTGRLITVSLLGLSACVEEPVFVNAGGGGGGGGTSVTTTTGSTSGATTSASASSTSTGTPSSCGNGALDAGEECDDGNSADDDGCDSDCIVECACMTCFKGSQLQPVCYQYVETAASRALGDAACAAWCADGCGLAQVHDQEELSAIDAGIHSFGALGPSRIWVAGLRVAAGRLDFIWPDGTSLPVDSPLWFPMEGTCPQEPTNYDPPENGVILWDCPDDAAGPAYRLADHAEAAELPYLCERLPPGAL